MLNKCDNAQSSFSFASYLYRYTRTFKRWRRRRGYRTHTVIEKHSWEHDVQGSTRNVTGTDVSKRRFARLQGDENTVYDKFFRWNVDSSDVIRSVTFHYSQTNLPVDICIVLGFISEYRHSLNVTFQPTTVCGSAQLGQPVTERMQLNWNVPITLVSAVSNSVEDPAETAV